MTTTLSFGGQPFAVTVLPQLHARAGVDNHFSLITDVAITDIDAFDSFGRAMLEQQQVSFTLAGDATVSASVAGISVTVTGVPFSKTVTIAGANNLTSAAVTSFSLTGSNASTAIVNLTVALANPSVVAIEPLGDLAVDVQYEGAYFGTLLCRNVSLQPGVNSLAFLGALTPADMGAADSLISAYLGGRPVIMTASASPDWPTSLPIYAPLLAGVVIATQLNGSATPLINSIVVERMSLAPQGLSDVAVTLNASVAINNILGPRSPIAVQSVDMNVTLYGGGQPLGQLIVSQVLESNVAAVGSGVSSSSSGSAPVKADAASASCAADTACLVVPQADVAASLYHARLDALRSSVADAQALPRRQLRGLPAEAADGSPALVNLRMPAADAQRFRLEWRPGEASAAGARGFQAAVLTGLAAAQSRGSEYSSTLLGDAAVGDAPLPIFYVPLSVQATLSIEQSAARFDSFILGFIANETVAMGLRNDDASALTTRLHCALGNLTVSIPLDQVTSVAGMGGFPFVSVDSFSVTGVRQPGQPVLFAPRLTSLAADIATAAAGDSVGGSRSTASLGSGAARSADAAGSASGLATDYGAVDIAIQVRLLNPSPATFSMGHNASFGMYVDGQRIGGALAVNTTLVPGMNVLHMNGSIAPQPSGLPAVSTLFTAYLTGRNGSVTVRGEGISLPEGQPTPQWLLDAIRSISLEASVPAAANLTVLQDVSLVSMSLDWAPPPPSVPSFAAVDAGDAAGGEVQSRGLRGGTGPEAGSPGEGSAAVASAATASALGNGSGGDRDADADPIPYLSAVVAGTVHLPFVIPVSFPAVDVTLVFTDPGSGIAMAYVELVGQRADYTPFATPQLPLSQRGLHFGSDSATASATAAGSEAASDIKDAAAATASRADVDATDSIVYPAVGALTLYLDRSPLHILAADVFASFMTTTLLASSAPLLLTGSASPTVSLVFGNITIANVSVTQLTPAPGMGGLAHPPPRVLSVDITNTTIDTATLSVCLNVTNPSIVTASLGPASLMLQYEGVDVATAFIENLQVSPGGNLLNATGLLRLPSNESDPVTYGAITTFISRYLSRVDSELRLLGTPQSSPYPLLQPAFSRLNTTAVFPGLSTNLLKSGTLYWDVDLFNIPTHPNGESCCFCARSLLPPTAELPACRAFGRLQSPHVSSRAMPPSLLLPASPSFHPLGLCCRYPHFVQPTVARSGTAECLADCLPLCERDCGRDRLQRRARLQRPSRIFL